MQKQYSSEAIKLALQHYFSRMKSDWRFTLPVLLLPGLGNILGMYAPPLIIAKILTRFVENDRITLPELFPYIAMFAGLWLLGEAFWRASNQFFNLALVRGVEQLYVNAMGYMLQKDLVFFHNNFSGSLTKRVISYARSYEMFVGTIAFSVFSNFVPLVFVVFILWHYSPFLVVALIIMTALTAFITTPLIKRRKGMVTEREIAGNATVGYVADVITNMDAVRAFAREDFEMKRHSENVANYISKAKRSWDYHNLVINVTISPIYVLTNVVGLVIAILVSQGTGLGLEAVFITFSYYAAFSRVMWDFNNIYRNIESQVTEAAQFTELLLENPTIKDPENAESPIILNSEVELKGLRFFYQDSSGQQLFNDLNLKIKSGEKIGLVGRSGGGKTTITKLLMRFMDIQEGEILIGGKNISKLKQSDLRNLLAYVPQEPIMFHRTIMENIRYGRLEATDEEVYSAARMAHAGEFIEKLHNGYETLIGERGVKLSGGQRQRVAIARAIVKNAPILVLDEATSSLDSESEKLIQDALRKLMESRTAIVIAHRLSTIQKMDRIIVLENGKIVEQGTHRELLETGGQYANLWAHQSGGFLEDQPAHSGKV